MPRQGHDTKMHENRPEQLIASNPIFELNRHATLFRAWHHHTVGPLDVVELLKRLPCGSRMPTYKKASIKKPDENRLVG
jgi:hypothetical protein